MKRLTVHVSRVVPLLLAAGAVQAQNAANANPDESMQEVVVTGSRIIQTSANSQQPLTILDRAAIERSSISNIGDLLQQATTSGKALNTKFNSSGNFG
jgi:iron complex outermembrane receptor protein